MVSSHQPSDGSHGIGDALKRGGGLVVAPNTGTTSSSTSAPASSQVRLFVGNLAPSVTDHDLLTAFRACGTLRKLDLIFHRTGPLKGQPKGFAFVEYASAAEASQAIRQLDSTRLRGREMRINYAAKSADQQNTVQHGTSSDTSAIKASASLPSTATRTVVSRDSTDAQIATMEAKLEAIRQSKMGAGVKRSRPDDQLTGSLPRRPAHLPPKPRKEAGKKG